MLKCVSLKLTKTSKALLRNWNGGAGQYFISSGNGSSYQTANIGLQRDKTGYYLWLGNSKNIKLTEEQVKVIGEYFVDVNK